MQNFGKIKNSFNTILVENLVKKDDASKGLFKNYVKTIKENAILKTQFLVYNNIENKIEGDKAKALQFVKENVALFSVYNTRDIFAANEKLSSMLTPEQLDGDYSTQELHENISKLIFTKKNPNNIDELIEAADKVAEYIVNNKPKEINETIDLPPSMVTTVFVDKYNEKYSSLTDEEKTIFKAVIDSDDEAKKSMYAKMLRECIDLVDAKYPTAQLEEKEMLLKAKDKLLNDKQEIDENFISKISKLIELKTNLS